MVSVGALTDKEHSFLFLLYKLSFLFLFFAISYLKRMLFIFHFFVFVLVNIVGACFFTFFMNWFFYSLIYLFIYLFIHL